MFVFLQHHPVLTWLICSLVVALIEGFIDLTMLDSKLHDHVPKWLLGAAILFGPITVAIGLLWLLVKIMIAGLGFMTSQFRD